MLKILPFLLLFVLPAFGQTYTSTIRGSVRDADSGLPLVGATVSLLPIESGAITDPQGAFRFENLAVGRYLVKVSYVGYGTISIPEILLESGKENVVQVKLSPVGRQLEEATVSASRPVAFNSVQAITIEQTLRYAATYMDPARVATSFPGVAAANDQANGLVVRGNSPNTLQWRLEGIEIVNPNHLSNAGTFTDRPTSTGGGVNILSTQLLSTSNFLSGPFPAQYGNVTGAVMDMNLRKGNDEKTEFTAQASLLGLDFAAEGPLSKKSKASYLVNYRYSFTGLLGAMGVNFGGEDIRFQDLAFNINVPTSSGTFTIFGMGGASTNDFKGLTDSTAWEKQKDGYNILYKNKMGAAGITHTLPISQKASLRTVVALSGLKTTRNSDAIYQSRNTPPTSYDRDAHSQRMVSVSSIYTYRFNVKNRIKTGAFYTLQSDRLVNDFNDFDTKILRPFVSWTYNPSPAITTEIGLHGFYSKLELDRARSHFLLEPRASLKWQASSNTQLTASYGLHSQLQLPDLYGRRYQDISPYSNGQLSPSRAHHFVVGLQQNFNRSSNIKIEAYWQEQFKIPVFERYRSSAINLLEGGAFGPYENAGTGRNYGLEVTYQKLLADQFYLLISGSVYDATYTFKKGGERLDSRFNGRHTFSFTGGKEIKNSKGNIWGFNTKILWLGGFREMEVSEESSAAANQTIYRSADYTVKMKDYFRPDLRIYWKKSRAKFSRTLALDLQNVAGIKNEAYRFYDTVEKKVVVQKQLGLIPVVSYRWEF